MSRVTDNLMLLLPLEASYKLATSTLQSSTPFMVTKAINTLNFDVGLEQHIYASMYIQICVYI